MKYPKFAFIDFSHLFKKGWAIIKCNTNNISPAWWVFELGLYNVSQLAKMKESIPDMSLP